jgi:hypothetical protein
LGKCPRHIAPADAMVDEIVETTQNTNKTQLLASNYGTNLSLINRAIFVTRKGPSTQHIESTSFVKT